MKSLTWLVAGVASLGLKGRLRTHGGVTSGIELCVEELGCKHASFRVAVESQF